MKKAGARDAKVSRENLFDGMSEAGMVESTGRLKRELVLRVAPERLRLRRGLEFPFHVNIHVPVLRWTAVREAVLHAPEPGRLPR
jgi:hypothetical protein